MKSESTQSPGRPRAFDRDIALDCAVNAFWAKGYSATSLDDLTESMSISRPSLYAAFGSKHDLFMEVIDRYATVVGWQPVQKFCKEPDFKKAVTAYLRATIRCVTSDGPKGCLISSVAVQSAETDEHVRQKLAGIYAEHSKVISDRIQSAQNEGQMPTGSDPQVLAELIISIMHSLATRARVGASRKVLFRLANEFTKVIFPMPEYQ